MHRLTISLILSLLLASSTSSADVGDDMRDLFDTLGAYGNVSAPRMISSQTRNVASFGSLYYRAPRRTYNVASVTYPSWRAGCGGIDVYGGSFSFINKEQFVQYLRNIASNSVGLAFKMALSSISPELSKTLEDLQKSTEALNRFNLDSCEAAQALVKGDVGTAMLGGETSCRNLGTFLNNFSDGAEARLMCSSQSDVNKVKKAVQKDSGDAAAAAPIEFTDGNMAWRILEDIGGLDDDFREVLMSMTGTYIFAPAAGGPRYVPPTIVGTKDLLAGPLRLLKCSDSDCTDVIPSTLSIGGGFRAMVAARLSSVRTKMINGGALTAAETSFISANSIPVLQIIQTDAAGAPGLADMATDAIALGVAYSYLAEAARLSRAAAASYQTRSAAEAKFLETLDRNAAQMMRDVFLEFSAEAARLSRSVRMHGDIAGIRDALWGGSFRARLRAPTSGELR